MLGFSVDEVATAAGWSDARQRVIEETDEPFADEADALSDLLGVDVLDLLEGEARSPTIAALMRHNTASLSANSRFAILDAARVADDVRGLERLLGRSEVWKETLKTFDSAKDYSHPSEGFPEKLAAGVRAKLNLGRNPIRSVQRDLLAPLGVTVLWTDLPEKVDAFAFADDVRGLVVVVNRWGSHTTTSFGRRVTLCHEICHLLFDRHVMTKVGRFCQVARQPKGKKATESLEDKIERRARAFAAYLLAQREDVTEFWEGLGHPPDRERVRKVMERYGMGFEATRTHLHHLNLLSFDYDVHHVDTDPTASLDAADPGPPQQALDRAAAGIALPRAGLLFDLVSDALHENLIGEGAARDFLRVPAQDWSRIGPLLGRRGGRWRTSAALSDELPQRG